MRDKNRERLCRNFKVYLKNENSINVLFSNTYVLYFVYCKRERIENGGLYITVNWFEKTIYRP